MSGLTLEEIRESARPILMRLALISEAPAGRIDAMPRTHGTPEHRKPTGNGRPVAEQLARRLASIDTVECALAIVEEARAELARCLRRAMALDTTETAEELADRIVEDGIGWPVDDVTLAMRCPPGFVRRSRLDRGRDPETGKTTPNGEPMEVARTLYEGGRSLRTIERLTGIPRSTLHDRLA